MKHMLLLAGAALIGVYIVKSKSVGSTNPTVDNTGTLAMSSVSNSVPMPGTGTNGAAAPAATVTGKQAAANPASLGSDSTTISGTQLNSPDSTYTQSASAIERGDYVHFSNTSTRVRQLAA